jgi:DNA polymerase elongation subunit (family B)
MYTSIVQRGANLCVRGVDRNGRFMRKIPFQPTLYVLGANNDSEWKDLNGRYVHPINPGSMYECKNYIEQYGDVENFKVYSPPSYAAQWITEEYPGEIRWNIDDVHIALVDIETSVEFGFPTPQLAQEEILLVTLYSSQTKRFTLFTARDYKSKDKDVDVVMCNDEAHLLKSFLNAWASNYPDVVSGWNTSLFDMPYLYYRITKVLGEEMAARLSPWKHVNARSIMFRGKEEFRAEIAGVANLDYLDLYKKFTYGAQESYRLDYIAGEELGEKKLESPGDGTFRDFYTNHWETFCSYNIHDVRLVQKLDAKMKFFELCFTLAYDAKILYEDVYSPVKMWDNIIYNYLLGQKTVIPPKPKVNRDADSSYEGGYVKDPLVGKHKWCVSFDLNSLYPHLIMQYNMSPETLLDGRVPIDFERLVKLDQDISFIKERDVALAANGVTFSKDRHGLLPQLMQFYYDRRVIAKKEMLECKQKFEETKDPKWQNEIARLNNIQMAVKIAINSAYGAFANAWFRYSDVRIAEGITKSGQQAIRFIADRLNVLLNKLAKTSDVDRVVLIDTDSVVLTLEDIVEDACKGKNTEQKIQFMDRLAEKIIQPQIDKAYQELADYMNAYDQKMVMKRENLADVMISVAKKRYVMNVHNSEGVQYAKPKLKVMGLAMVRSSTPAVVRSKLEDSLPIILHGSESDVKSYVSDYKQDFMKLSIEEIAFPRGVSNLKTYTNKDTIYKKGSCPIHVRASLLYNWHLDRLGLSKKYEKIKEGDKIKFLYLKTPNPFQENVIAFISVLPPEFGLNDHVDYETMFVKTFQEGVQNVLDPLGWSADTRATLEDWFA